VRPAVVGCRSLGEPPDARELHELRSPLRGAAVDVIDPRTASPAIREGKVQCGSPFDLRIGGRQEPAAPVCIADDFHGHVAGSTSVPVSPAIRGT
jgi:hypothetical protein